MTFYTGEIRATGRIVQEDGSDFWQRARKKIMMMVFQGDLPHSTLNDPELMDLLDKVPTGSIIYYSTRNEGVRLNGYKCVIIHEDTPAGWGLCIFFPNCKPEELNDQNLFPEVETPIF